MNKYELIISVLFIWSLFINILLTAAFCVYGITKNDYKLSLYSLIFLPVVIYLIIK